MQTEAQIPVGVPGEQAPNVEVISVSLLRKPLSKRSEIACDERERSQLEEKVVELGHREEMLVCTRGGS
jgi:hypothetical protein